MKQTTMLSILLPKMCDDEDGDDDDDVVRSVNKRYGYIKKRMTIIENKDDQLFFKTCITLSKGIRGKSTHICVLDKTRAKNVYGQIKTGFLQNIMNGNGFPSLYISFSLSSFCCCCCCFLSVDVSILVLFHIAFRFTI